MKFNELSDTLFRDLIENAFKKLSSTKNSEKALLDNNSSFLNWLLLILSLFLGVQMNTLNLINLTCSELVLLISYLISFVLFLCFLLLYKILENQYSQKLNYFLDNLHTHKLELLYPQLRRLREEIGDCDIFIPDFANNLSTGNFVSNYDKIRKDGLRNINQSLDKKSVYLRMLYVATIILFILNFILFSINTIQTLIK